ncbi:MAG: hypothetical protein EWV42_21730 [Microcystis panniformis Mp_GB_SS_20050300_S99D]|nr:MAG: hypothetical protein EWV42_21730 [Microcystis panniformis Mp_GB_SS_20050300_S99D]
MGCEGAIAVWGCGERDRFSGMWECDRCDEEDFDRAIAFGGCGGAIAFRDVRGAISVWGERSLFGIAFSSMLVSAFPIFFNSD